VHDANVQNQRYCEEGRTKTSVVLITLAGDRRHPNLTTLTRRHEEKYPAGYVGVLVKFGRNPASRESEDLPVWGLRFKELDPVRDPTGQQHIDDVVAYIASIQAK
jgi:hypothetical protein